jgi:cytoskeletal protein CcmA (bactofilin family)
MNEIQIPDGSYINSIIGEGTRFNGEFDLNGLLRVDGDFCGTVRTRGKVLVGKNGRASCTIYAGTVVVGGIVRGNIFAEEKVVILSTGIVLGNIHSPRFIVEEGVIFNGTCRIVHDKVQDNALDKVRGTVQQHKARGVAAQGSAASPERPHAVEEKPGPEAKAGTQDARSAAASG